MDQLEKLITQQIDSIQNDVPPEGHLERFELKLKRTKNKRHIPWLAYASSVAAVLVLAILVFNPRSTKSNDFSLSDVSEQYADVEFYYTSSINKQLNRIQRLAKENEKVNPVIRLLLDDLEKYDASYAQLCVELEATPNDDRVINALINYYKSKLEIITSILYELDKQQQNLIDHENNNT